MSISALSQFDPLGLTPGKADKNNIHFLQKGPYKYVRHPLYLFSILFIWSTTVLTIDRLVFNGLWTVWIIAGTWWEDRDLQHAYPERFGVYLKKVPMIFPVQMCRHMISRHAHRKGS